MENLAQDTSERTLADRAYRTLMDAILGGRLLPGRKLKLKELGAAYDVGTAPLREALSRLTGDLLVVGEGQRGFWVAPISLAELDDLTEVRALIECEALNRSIARGNAAWAAGLTAAYEALAELERDLPSSGDSLDDGLRDEWERRNSQFHAALVAACESPTLLRMRATLYRQSLRYRHLSLDVSRERRHVDDEHAEIYEAAIARNALRACRMLERHVKATAEEVRRYFLANAPSGAAAAS